MVGGEGVLKELGVYVEGMGSKYVVVHSQNSIIIFLKYIIGLLRGHPVQLNAGSLLRSLSQRMKVTQIKEA